MTDDPSAPSVPAPSQAPVKPRRKIGCWGMFLIALGVVGVFFLAIAIALWVAWSMFRAEPEYWKKNREKIVAKAPAVLEQEGKNFELRLVDDASIIRSLRPGDGKTEHTILIGVDELNAWLATRFPAWAQNQNLTNVDRIKDPMVVIEGEDLVLAAKVQSPQAEQIVSAVMHMEMLPTGQAKVTLKAVRAGNLPLPYEMLAKSLLGESSGHNAVVSQLELLGQGMIVDPVRRGDAGNVRLVDFKIRPDGIEAKFRAEESGDHGRDKRAVDDIPPP